MNFAKKQFSRFGKTSETFSVTFKPLSVSLNIQYNCTIHLVYKRGPQREETSKYKMEKQGEGRSMQELQFNKEVFSKNSGFYREKDG